MPLEELPEGAIQIGPNEWYTRYVDKDGKWIGIIDWHYNKQDNLCEGSVLFDVPSAYVNENHTTWTVESFDPLTLSPSLLCTVCGHHGYIREGKWVNC